MGRRQRIHFPGAIYHAMSRGVDGRVVFVGDRDRTAFLDRLRRIEREAAANVMAFCLMGNHFHLAIQVGSVPLASIMHRLLTSYCMNFNRRHSRAGHLFQARYKAITCVDDRYLAKLIHYIHMNPVRAGLVSGPEDWPWSSYKTNPDSEEELADFDPWPREVDFTRRSAASIDLETIGSSLATRAGIALDRLRGGFRNPEVVEARRLFVREAIHAGHPLLAAANWLNISRRSASRYTRNNNVLLEGLTPI